MTQLRVIFPTILACLSAVLSCSRESSRAISGGVYFRRIKTDVATATFAKAGADLPFSIDLPTGGFDLTEHKIIYVSENKITVSDFNLKRVEMILDDLAQLKRPSFNAEATLAVLQGRERTNLESTEDINIYIVDLNTARASRISLASYNEESPEWFPTGDKIAYFSYAPDATRLHVYDHGKGAELFSVNTGPALHAAVSKDGKKILVPQQFKILNAETGELLTDFKVKVTAGLLAAGYTIDTCCTGVSGVGPFPLDGDFSPDGTLLVLDAAVKKGTESGVILFQVNTSGDELKIIQDLLPATPGFSNNHNYSQLNPSWL